MRISVDGSEGWSWNLGFAAGMSPRTGSRRLRAVRSCAGTVGSQRAVGSCGGRAQEAVGSRNVSIDSPGLLQAQL